MSVTALDTSATNEPVVFFVEKTGEFVCFTATPFTEPDYAFVESEPGFSIYIGSGDELTLVEIDFVEVSGIANDIFGIDTKDSRSIVIYPPSTAERHPNLHGRLQCLRMLRLKPEEFTLEIAGDKAMITMR